MSHAHFTPSSAEVAARMRRQKRQGTGVERAVRRMLYAAGLRYRLHRRVPGMPRRTMDISFPGPRVAVFLDGCFWHGCPQHRSVPKANEDLWRRKFDRNAERDAETTGHLESLGWTVLRFWEHDPPETVASRVAEAVIASRDST